MLAAVPGCGMCVSAFQRSFESSSRELKGGRLEEQYTAGSAPHKLADPMLKGRSLRQTRILPLAMPRTEKLKCCKWGCLQDSSSVTAGVFRGGGGCMAALLHFSCVWPPWPRGVPSTPFTPVSALTVRTWEFCLHFDTRGDQPEGA